MTDIAQLGFGRAVFREDHDAYRESLRRFFKTEIEPNVREWEKIGFFPAELFRAAGKAGLLCPAIPVEYEGAGGDLLHHAVFYEEHGYSVAGAPMEAGLCTSSTSFVILNGGTEEQKKEWLPQFVTGEVICEVGLSEPGAGSDVAGIKTTAKRDGSDYILNGQKAWISNAPIANMLVVAAKVGGGDRDDPIGMFIVDYNETKGVTVGKPTELMLKGAGGCADVFLDNVRVPERCVLGGSVTAGMSKALGTVTVSRLTQCARMLAACELAFAMTVDFVKSRQAFGQTIFDFQNTKFKLAEVKTEITVARGFLDALMSELTTSTVDPVRASIAKLWISEMEGRVMDTCLQLHGGSGYSDEYPISKMYAFARVHRIYLGTSEVQKVVISRSI